MKKTPKKYYHRTNHYGNLRSFPITPGGKRDPKWIEFADAEVTRRKPGHRAALDSQRIHTYKVLIGWSGKARYGFNPVTVEIIHQDQLALFTRLSDKHDSDRKKQCKK